MANRRTLDEVFREVVGEETYQKVQQLKNRNRIGSVESDRREHERRQKQIDEEKLREAAEDEERRFPDK